MDEKPVISTETSKSSEQAANPDQPTNPSDPAPKGFHRWVDTINKLIQILAVLIGGIWVWKVFQQTVVPGLEPKIPVDTEIHWAMVPGTAVCQGRFEVSVKNDGLIPFDVTKVMVTGWIVDLEKAKLIPQDSVTPAHLDPAITKPGRADSIEPFETGNGDPVEADLKDHYPPGGKSSSSANFFFKQRPKTVVILLANLEGERPASYLPFAKKLPIANYSYAIDQVCGADWDKGAPPKTSGNLVPKPTPTKSH